jgi:SH3-like domain-containing protein
MSKTSSFSRPALFFTLIGAMLFLLASTATAEEYVSVLKNGVNIRSGPDTNKEILWTVFKGFPLQVKERQGKWAQVVDFEGDKGWIFTDLLAKEKTVIVKVTTANLRVGAGKDYEIAAEVKHGVVFKPLETEGDWVKVKHTDGTSGWILGRLLWPNL